MVEYSFMHFVSGYLEGKLSREELRDFYEMLEKSAENREYFAQMAIINRLIETSKRPAVSAEQIIKALPRHGDTVEIVLDQLRGSSEDLVVEDGKGKVINVRKRAFNRAKPASRETRRNSVSTGYETPGIIYFFRTLAAAAACALVTFGVWRFSHQAAEPSLGPSLAYIEYSGNVTISRGNQTIQPDTNAKLYNGDVITAAEQAMAVIRYNDEGTSIKLRERSILKLEDNQGAKHLSLNSGAIAASVAHQPEGKPMIIATPTASATVLGTSFSMKSREESTTLEVISGKVRITRETDRNSADVSTGNRVEVNRDSPLSVESITKNPVLGHLSDAQIADVNKTMSTAKSWGINTLTYNITTVSQSALPANLKTAINMAHRDDVKFYAKVDIPKDAAAGYDSFMKQTRDKLSKLVKEYDFDGVYVTRPKELKDDIQFNRIMTDIYRTVNNSGLAIAMGVQREVSSDDAWAFGY